MSKEIIAKKAAIIEEVFEKFQSHVAVAEWSGRNEIVGVVGGLFVPADQGLDLGAKDHGVEWFGDVVVRPDIQAVQGVEILGAPAENDDGNVVAGGAQTADRVEPVVHPVHHNI